MHFKQPQAVLPPQCTQGQPGRAWVEVCNTVGIEMMHLFQITLYQGRHVLGAQQAIQAVGELTVLAGPLAAQIVQARSGMRVYHPVCTVLAVQMVQYVHKGRVLQDIVLRSEEHTSELQSLMRISYAVFCLKKKNKIM